VTPVVAQTHAELAAARAALRGRVAVVMTMGALHDGHAVLIREARRFADSVVVTVFLNPLQFAAGEDLDRYPKRLEEDVARCAAEGVELVFAPTPDVVYPGGDPGVRVSAGALGDVLEGEHRPGHFDGVLTVVAKLLHLIAPDVALFGEKDAQQLALIRRMVDDLDFPVQVVGVPTVRDGDGLALSSRNGYLTDADRDVALTLHRALSAGAAAATGGPDRVLERTRAVLAEQPAVGVDYVALIDEETWGSATNTTGRARLLVAARVGSTRLIDNVPLSLSTTSAPSVG
jgi:pantoate--beta-alanine ligase